MRARMPVLCLLIGLTGLLPGSCGPASPVSPSRQDVPLPTEAELSGNPALVRQWAERVMVQDPKERAAAVGVLVGGGEHSLPLLRRFLRTRDEALHAQAFEIVRRIGPGAMPLLTALLRDERVLIRREAVSVLIDLAPETESIAAELCSALKDQDEFVARDAARALGALGNRAAGSVSALVGAMSHDDEHVRLYAAEALASIGPAAAAATGELARALRDPVPGVRWAACEALGSIGPGAAGVVPELTAALRDEFLYVRICAAGALGNMGARAAAAVEPLKQASKDPSMHAEAEWALERITGVMTASRATSQAAKVSIELRQEPAAAGNPPPTWNTKTGMNIAWSVQLGDETFGRPVVSGGVVYIGTDNGRKMNPAVREECGVLMAFGAADGRFLWQDAAPRVKRGLREFLLPSTTGAPYVEGDRLYYVTAECKLRCLDTAGFRDGENDGPFRDERFTDVQSADMVWELDLCARLGVFVHEAANSEVLALGDLLVVSTSNGRNEGHTRVPSPRAPSVVAVDKRTGDVVWSAIGPGEKVLHGQWCSPIGVNVKGQTQVLWGGGDGWLRGFDAASGRELWRFDGNPKGARWLPRPGVFSRSPIVASPVHEGGKVFIAMGQDPSHGDGPSLVHAIDLGETGDVTEIARLWTSRAVGRVVGKPIVSEGLLYVADVGGRVHCLDAATGATVWSHDTDGAIWGCLLLVRDRLYVGNVDGAMTVLRAGRRKEVLAEIEMDAALYARPALVGDSMYVASARRLYHLASPR